MTSYVLGSDAAEIARLDAQAASLDAPSRMLLRAAGLGPGMRVLDLGTGLGHVARAIADLVGPTGEVVGIDADPVLVEVARERAAGGANQRFEVGDVRSWRDNRPFDAVVGRLILFHLPDAVAVVRHHAAGLAPGGRVVALDFDLGSARCEPPTPLPDQALAWTVAAFRHAHANPTIGARLALLLAEAGLIDPQGFGVQAYLAPDDPRGPVLLAGVARTLAGRSGLSPSVLGDLETLEERIAAAVRASGAVILPPALVGAWARVRPAS